MRFLTTAQESAKVKIQLLETKGEKNGSYKDVYKVLLQKKNISAQGQGEKLAVIKRRVLKMGQTSLLDIQY